MTTRLLAVGDGVKSINLATLREWAELGNMPWGTGANGTQTTHRLAGTVGYLFRSVELRANAVSSVPWGVYQGTADKPIWDSEAPIAPPTLAAFADLPELIYRTEAALSLGSQAFWFRERNRVRLLALRWLDPQTMEPVWTSQGLAGYKRTVNGATFMLPVEEVVYLWYKGQSETEPRTAPASAAAAAANVLYNTAEFSKAFFARGAIKATLLTVDGVPLPAEREKLKTLWERMLSGIKNAFAVDVVSASVKPVVIGDGIQELANTELTQEQREDIATAMGVPHSLVMSNAANYATAEVDARTFYETTVVPECNLIERQLNQQLFSPMGLRFSFNPQALDVFQKDENERAAAFAAYVNAGIKQSIVAQMLGLELPEGITYEDLDPEEPPVQLVEAPGDAADAFEREEEEARFKRWAAKRKRPDVSRFKSALLSDAEKEALLGETGAPFRPAWDVYP